MFMLHAARAPVTWLIPGIRIVFVQQLSTGPMTQVQWVTGLLIVKPATNWDGLPIMLKSVSATAFY